MCLFECCFPPLSRFFLSTEAITFAVEGFGHRIKGSLACYSKLGHVRGTVSSASVANRLVVKLPLTVSTT